MNKEDVLYIIIPAYNEQDNIKEVINEWYPIIEKYNGNNKSKLVVIDDGSKDSTYEIIKNESKLKPLLIPLTKKNSGHGATVLYGYNYALENNADYIFQTDSDLQTLPSEFHQFWKERYNNDLVIGHRKNRKDGISRKIVTKVLKLTIKKYFKENVKDANTPFRLINSDSLRKYINLIPEDYFLSNVALTVIFTKMKLKVKYIEITFRERQGGINSINLKRIFKIGKQAFKDFKVINKNIEEKINEEKNNK